MCQHTSATIANGGLIPVVAAQHVVFRAIGGVAFHRGDGHHPHRIIAAAAAAAAAAAIVIVIGIVAGGCRDVIKQVPHEAYAALSVMIVGGLVQRGWQLSE